MPVCYSLAEGGDVYVLRGYAVNFKVIRCQEIGRDIKALRKKYRHAEDDLRGAERLLEKGKPLRYVYPYPGFGIKQVYKARYINQDLGPKGLSSGYRIVYEVIDDGGGVRCFIIIYVYSKKGGTDEKGIKREVIKRMGSDGYPVVAS